MKKAKQTEPKRSCFDCDHYMACRAQNGYPLAEKNAEHCALYAEQSLLTMERERNIQIQDELNKDIARLEAQLSKWISVEERLPEPFVSVLVQMPQETPLPTVHEGYRSNDGKWYSNYFVRDFDEVTHWMPLPEPPKEEEHERSK